ncbi:MAG: hypothetical protein ACK4RN_18645 [Pseudorhodobacter sp.]
MTRDIGDALDRIEDARKLLNLVAISCLEQESSHLKAILVACEVTREKLDDALSELELHWTAGGKPVQEGGAA